MSKKEKRFGAAGRPALMSLLVLVSIICAGASAENLDLCGCKEHPQSLGDFDPARQESWPPGSVMNDSKQILTIPLPPDGVLIFNSFNASPWGKRRDYQIRFEKNAGNTPVTLLAAGDITIGPYVTLYLAGNDGSSGNVHINGRGGAPGPGGFRGGDGAYLDVNGANDGGEGQGPGGGAAGIGKEGAATHGSPAKFAGSRDLRPLIGGSGGGGGASTRSGNCAASGGGGGGGAVLMVANGSITVDGGINADGGRRGPYISDGKCSTYGAYGSGGAIRLVAQSVVGKGGMSARGDRGHHRQASPGVIRIESLNDDGLRPDWTAPPPIRTNVIGPVVNPVRSEVAITAIAGQAVPEALQGINGNVDLIVKAPGAVKVQVLTRGVPAGTTVEVAMKPKVGGAALKDRAELNASGCNPAGECTAFISFELPSGTYFAEARATFQTP